MFLNGVITGKLQFLIVKRRIYIIRYDNKNYFQLKRNSFILTFNIRLFMVNYTFLNTNNMFLKSD
jgi:hypothetical protein